MAVLLDTRRCANIHLHEGTGTLELQWLQFCSGDVFHAIVLRALALARQYGTTQWLAQNAQMRTVREADQNWLVKVSLPLFAALDIQRLAIVRCTDAMARMSIAAVLAAAPPELLPAEVQQFDGPLAAMTWLGLPPTLSAAENGLWPALQVPHPHWPAGSVIY